MHDRFRVEIEALHAFFVDWFSGSVPADDAAFERRFTSRFSSDFELVQPAGQRLSLDDLAAGLRGGYGKSPEFRIAIRNIHVVRAIGECAWLVRYEEWQRGAKNSTPSENGRISCVLFEKSDGNESGIEWVYVHETWLPDEVMRGASYDF